MESRGISDQLNLAQRPGGRSEDTGRFDHRYADDTGADPEGARGVRDRVKKDPVFLAGSTRCQTGRGPQARRYGETPARDEEVLFGQDAALQLSGECRGPSRAHRM